MDSRSPLVHAKHVFRAGFLFLVGVVALVVLRSLLQPPTWGEFGPYRGASVADCMALPVRHGGVVACAECHDDYAGVHQAGVHAPVGCEICHAPVGLHVADGDHIADMPIRKNESTCLRCHEERTARPKSFPQIVPAEHIAEMGGEPGPESCFECHDPHSPL
ncbi:MAG: cytochrome C [Candidatus Eisenbacteria bacterium]